ncbi:hypothetical protein HEP74_02850 [Xanthomonas sp. SS]|nr:hypothetical protein HEP74_02850 [Xanthomonas sp. SS]
MSIRKLLCVRFRDNAGKRPGRVVARAAPDCSSGVVPNGLTRLRRRSRLAPSSHRIARPPMPHAPLLILPTDALRISAGRVRLPDGMDRAEP